MPEPYYRDEQVTIYNCDWRDVVTTIDPDLVLTDPPYGIRAVNPDGTMGGPSSAPNSVHVPVANDHDAEEAKRAVELLRLVPKQIWWGANHYGEVLLDASGWLVWDKQNGTNFFADAELAWTNLGGVVRLYRHKWQGMLRASERGRHWHPTQKPVALMDWCLRVADLEPASLVFDPFMGSGPVAVAAKAQGHRYIGCDVVEEYCEIAAQRCQQAYLGI